MNSKIAIYFHWPFCAAKCPYCDFNVHVRDHIDHNLWKENYLKAIRYYAGLTQNREVVSVFFGGGTPSLMEPDTVAAIIKEIRACWKTGNNVEITLEANPTSVETEKFENFRMAGINRVSLGVQSLKDDALKFLGRKHAAAQAIAAINTAKSIFECVSFDLIYARPNQTLKDWQIELEEALTHAAGHLSLYQLTIERSTPFYLDEAQKKFTMPGDGHAADLYELTQDITAKAGLPAYEVSNHAASGHESIHNLVYWRYGDYIGIGPGAHGRLTLNDKKFATREHSAPDIWLERMAHEGRAHHPFEEIPPRGRFVEALMMGLRLPEGIAVQKLESEGACKFTDIIDLQKLKKLQAENWLSFDNKTLRLNRSGMLRLNAILPFILK